MKFLKNSLLAFLVASTSMTFAAGFETTRDRELTSGEMEALERYMDSKHVLTNDKGRLNLDGELQFKYLRVNAKTTSGAALTGSGTDNSKNAFEARVYLNFRARGEKTWADARLRFVNRLGIVNRGGSTTTIGSVGTPKITIRAANVGYFLVDDGVSTWTAMAGREELSKLFDSSLQYGSNMDGITTKYIRDFKGVVDFGARGALILVDERNSHFSYIVQLDFMNIYDSGFYGRYSFTDWSSGNKSLFVDNTTLSEAERVTLSDLVWGYRISQFQIGYDFAPEVLKTEANLFAEYLINTKSKNLDSVLSGLGKQDRAWAIGLRVGKLRKKDDWYCQARYERVEANAVPYWDVDGIGRGDIDDYIPTSTASASDYQNQVLSGRNNYRGFILEGAYAVTDEFVGKLTYQQSKALQKQLSEMGNYSQWEARVSYTF